MCHLVDVVRRDQLLARSGGDMALYARLLLRDAEPPPSCTCAADGSRAERNATRLMQAITIAETHATLMIERAVETAVVWTAAALGLKPPDLSIGPGQIKPSTALAALGNTQIPVAAEPPASLARRLLDTCGNLNIGARVILWIAATTGISLEEPGAWEIQTIARYYNGGDDALAASQADRALALQLYGELVYQLYQELTFRTLQNALAEQVETGHCGLIENSYHIGQALMANRARVALSSA